MYTIIDAKAYQKELPLAIDAAKDKITIAAMGVLWDDGTQAIRQALLRALLRGVWVNIFADIYSKSLFIYNPFVPKNFLQAPHARRVSNTRMAELLAAGATVQYIGTMQLNPYKGRFHQKFTIIDSTSYFAGGVNMVGGDFAHTDYMIKTENPAVVSTLEKITHLVTKDTKNHSYTLDDKTSLLVDGGEPHSSLIYDRAVELASEAASIIYVSQHTPNDKLARLLRQKDARLYYTRPLQMENPAALRQFIDRVWYGLPNSYLKPPYLHAKCLLFTMPDGSKKLISGSHNFTHQSVSYGTREIAIVSSDTQLWDQLYNFVKNYVQ